MKSLTPLPTTPGIYKCWWKHEASGAEEQYYNFFDGEFMYSGHVAPTPEEYERKINEKILNGEPFNKLDDDWTLVSWTLEIPYGNEN